MSFLTLDLNLLRVFDAIMSEQNLTRAANRLAMTQPAVSNALKRLRDTLDDELLVRTAHGMKPTVRAEELWPAVRNALANLEAAIAPEKFDLSDTQATFRLAMADSTASLLLPPLMEAIRTTAPGINIRVLPLTTRDPRTMLLQNDLDLAVGSFPGVVEQLAGSQTDVSPIHHKTLYSGDHVCVMRKDHPLAHGELTLADFCNALHVVVSFSGRATDQVSDYLTTIGRDRRIALTVNEFFTAGRVVSRSDLISAMPRHLIATIGMSDMLISRELPLRLQPINVDMLWHERDMRNMAHRWLRDSLIAITEETVARLAA